MPDETPKTISVLPGPATDGHRVGLWDVDKAHPGGEAWVAPDTGGNKPAQPVQVAETAAVLQALSDGRLVKADSPEAKALEAPKAAK
jgi:hypothetical protein